MWGFFFGWIAIIVALCQEDINLKNKIDINNRLLTSRSVGNQNNPDGWVCKNCHTFNLNYVGRCGCGYTKEQSTKPLIQPTEDPVIEEIKKYKELFDTGVITEQEFELKKRKLLGI